MQKRVVEAEMQPQILITAPMSPVVYERLEGGFTVHRLWEARDPTAFLQRVGPQIRGVATSSLFGAFARATLDLLPSLEIISNFGVGYDNVDAVEAARRGVVVTNTPGVLDEEVADLTLALTLATVRRLPQADRYVREGRWPGGAFPLSPTLRGRTVGIVGLGRIGKAVARRLEGFGVAIAYHARSAKADVAYPYHPTLGGLAAACDILIVLTPGGEGTRHLIDRKVLQALGPDGILINVARGSVVDQQALIHALRSGAILSAGLDVFEDEPHVPAELIEMEQVVLLPHVGSGSLSTREAMATLVAENLIAWFTQGEPLTPVPETPVRSRRENPDPS